MASTTSDGKTEDNSVVDSVMKRRNSTCVTIIGKIRHVDNISRFEWIFLALAILSSLISIGITIERMISRIESDTADFTYALLLFANIGFCLYYVIRGVFQERPYEIIVFVVTNFIVLIYLIINFADKPPEENGLFKKLRLGFGCFFAIPNIGIGLYYGVKYWRSNNLVFRIVGGLPEMQRICLIFFVCEGFIVFDFQCQISLLILALKKGVDIADTQLVILLIGTALAVPWSTLGYFALRKESKILCYIFWASSWISPAYIIYKYHLTATTMNPSDVLYEVSFVAGSLALITRIALVINSVWAYSNFDKGYKQKRYNKESLFEPVVI